MIPSCMLWSLVKEEHEKMRWGIDVLYSYLKDRIIARTLQGTVIQVTRHCSLCHQTNPKTIPKPKLGQKIGKGYGPGQFAYLQWQIDFSESPRRGEVLIPIGINRSLFRVARSFPYQNCQSVRGTQSIVTRNNSAFWSPSHNIFRYGDTFYFKNCAAN